MPFTLASIQFAPEKGRVSANLDKIADLARQAVDQDADLCLFPEAAVSGYFLEGGTSEHSLTGDGLLDELTKRLNGLPRPVDVALGFYEKNGGQPYNSAAYVQVGGA